MLINNWDDQFDNLMSKASKTVRLYILRECKADGYSVQDLHYLFNHLIMYIFIYCLRVYAIAPKSKYLSQIDRKVKSFYVWVR